LSFSQKIDSLPSENGEEGAFWLLQGPSKVLQLLLHEQTGHLLRHVAPHHGAVGPVGGAKGVIDIDIAQLGEGGPERSNLLRGGLDLTTTSENQESKGPGGSDLPCSQRCRRCMHHEGKGSPTFFPVSSSPLPSSSTWKRRFSRRITEPAAGSAQAASISAPTQSLRKVTFLPSSSSSLVATGPSESLGTTWPSGRPRWLISTTALAPSSTRFHYSVRRHRQREGTLEEAQSPFSRAYLIVGTAATILWSELILPSLKGTLKSTLMSTRLLLRSTCSIDSLLEIDIVWVAKTKKEGGMIRQNEKKRKRKMKEEKGKGKRNPLSRKKEILFILFSFRN